METLSEFIKRNNIRVEIVDGPDFRTENEGSKWDHYYYKIRVHFNGRRYTTKWMQGVGVVDDPANQVRDILEDLIMTYQAYEDFGDADDLANEYGYDLEEEDECRRVENLWREINKAGPKIERLFGGEEAMREIRESVDRSE